MGACFLSHLLLLYIGRVHGAISGCTVLWEVHPASAQYKNFRTLSYNIKSFFSLPVRVVKFKRPHVLGNQKIGEDN